MYVVLYFVFIFVFYLVKCHTENKKPKMNSHYCTPSTKMKKKWELSCSRINATFTVHTLNSLQLGGEMDIVTGD